MDSELIQVISKFIADVGLPGFLTVGGLALLYRIIPTAVALFTRNAESLERIADSLGGLTASQDGLKDDIRDMRQEAKEGFQSIKELLSGRP